MRYYSLFCSVLFLVSLLFPCTTSFLNQPRSGRGIGGIGGRHGGSPPKSTNNDYISGDSSSNDPFSFSNVLYYEFWKNHQNSNNNNKDSINKTITSMDHDDDSTDIVGIDIPVHCNHTIHSSKETREVAGNSSYNKNQVSIRGGGGDIVKGTTTTLSSTANWWKNTFQTNTEKLSTSITKAKNSLFRSREQKEEEELLETLRTMPIRSITIPNTTVIPTEIVHLAAQRSGIIGNPLRTDRIQSFASILKQYYIRKGYVLHSVTGATLQPETATAQITVEEPKIAKTPVNIIFCKEMIIDEETGKLLTYRQYKEKHKNRKTFGYEKITKEDTNRTMIQTNGNTNPNRIANALSLHPGRPFRWDVQKWQNVLSTGIFSKILTAQPERMKDGSVQLQIIATEAPARHLEYGVTKSLYTGGWEGEIDFQHCNLLGGAETLGFIIRRGAKDVEPSVRVRYSDDKFGMPGGYDAEIFTDYIGHDDNTMDDDNGKSQSMNEDTIETGISATAGSHTDYDHDNLLTRRGISFRLRNPINKNLIQYSSSTACVERTTTKTGLHETIGSTSLSVGPFLKLLPYNAKSNVGVTLTTGTRVPDVFSLLSGSSSSSSLSSFEALPYSSACISTKQILPISSSPSYRRRQSSSNLVVGDDNEQQKQERPIVLALRHSLTTSSRNLPRHEGNAFGIAGGIRGYDSLGRIKSSLVGTTEIRLPIQLPSKIMSINKIRQDCDLILFCDYACYSKKNNKQQQQQNIGIFNNNKSSVGVGLRKSVQGLPLKLDISYSNEGKFKIMTGLGKDFDV